MQQGSLKNICSYSFPGNSVLMFSLVQQEQDMPFKKEYFFFMSCAPGVQGQNGRTFDFQSRFTIKMDIDKIAALQHAIIMYATGRKGVIGNFSIFADGSKSNFSTGGSSKSVYLNDGKDKNGNPNVSLMFKQGQSKAFPYVMTVANALGLCDVLKVMVKKAMTLEFSRTNIQIKPSMMKANGAVQQNNVPYSPQNTNNPTHQQMNTNTQKNIANNFSNTLSNMGNTTQQSVHDEIPF